MTNDTRDERTIRAVDEGRDGMRAVFLIPSPSHRPKDEGRRDEEAVRRPFSSLSHLSVSSLRATERGERVMNGERTGKGTYEWWILLWILWVSFVIFIIKSIINPPTK